MKLHEYLRGIFVDQFWGSRFDPSKRKFFHTEDIYISHLYIMCNSTKKKNISTIHHGLSNGVVPDYHIHILEK